MKFLILSFVLFVGYVSAAEPRINYEKLREIEDSARLLVESQFESDDDLIENIKIDESILEDARLTTPELIKKYGYETETHYVVTEDNFILAMHRIPNPGGIPVYLQHGIMDSSAGWIIMGPHAAFGYYLADLGYDVWMGNLRGNRYSRNHTEFNPDKSSEFWDFSFHKNGQYDLPAMIDYVLNETGFEKLQYVGHSQGTTAFWAMCSLRTEYCDKVLSMQAMAPIAFMSNVKSPVLRLIAPFVGSLNIITSVIGLTEFKPNGLQQWATQKLCNDEAITQTICTNIIFLITGYNAEQFNKTMLPAILAHLPAGASTKQFVHYGQLINSGKFREYDYGYVKNYFKYGAFSPPEYDLSKVTAPVALHYSGNDWLASLPDVYELQDNLPNVIKRYFVPMPEFNHLDFLVAKDMRSLVHEEVVATMRGIEIKAGWRTE